MNFARKVVQLSIAAISVSASVAFAYGGEPVCVVGATSKSGQQLGTAAKGFAARVGGRTVLITTAHGLSALMGNTDAKSMFKGEAGAITMMDTSGREMGKVGQCLISNAPGGFYTADLFAFDISGGTRLEEHTLLPTLPPRGTRVFVLSKEGENFGSRGGADKYAGTVTSATSDAIMVQMDKPLTAYHSSGSPVVDDRGYVVGMLIGTADGRTTVGLNPSYAILQRLDPRYAAAATRGGTQIRGTQAPSNTRSGVQSYR